MKRNLYLLTTAILLIFSGSVLAAHAIAASETSTGYAYYWSVDKPSKKIAEKEALKGCEANAKKYKHKSKCFLSYSGTGPTYIAFFHAENGEVFMATHTNRQQAIDNAYDECSKERQCPQSAEHVVFDSGENSKKINNCSPPTGKTLRYSDRCFNGDCIRTFDNGCQKRFQAPYCYDPFQQKWDWKPNGC